MFVRCALITRITLIISVLLCGVGYDEVMSALGIPGLNFPLLAAGLRACQFSMYSGWTVCSNYQLQIYILMESFDVTTQCRIHFFLPKIHFSAQILLFKFGSLSGYCLDHDHDMEPYILWNQNRLVVVNIAIIVWSWLWNINFPFIIQHQ